jgi:L-ribulose-5-phosphate 3-epimerase
MNPISFVTANYVARQVGYHMTGGWSQGDKATNDYFRPLETFAQRFEQILLDVRALGFEALDVWTAHLHWAWATPDHYAIARDLIARHNLQVVSIAGGFGSTHEEFDAACKLALALNTTYLAGMTLMLATDRAFVVGTLQKYDLKLAIENHPEKTPEEMLEKIGDGGSGTLGTAVDTGWYGTQGYDAARAIEKLGSHVFLVHLKDVREPGKHDTCQYGQGCVDIEACVKALKKIGYQGAYTVEHEPDDRDPTPEIRENVRMLRGWLAT